MSTVSSSAFKVPGSVQKSSTVDSFSNLVSFGSSKQAALTLQEQQEKLQAEKAKKDAERKRQFEAQFGNTQFWDGLGAKSVASNPLSTSRTSTPVIRTVPPRPNGSTGTLNKEIVSATGDEDIFTAFNADTKVDNSSHYPPPAPLPNAKDGHLKSQFLDFSNPKSWESDSKSGLGNLGEDDDPFGLRGGKVRRQVSLDNYSPADNEDDDLLGDLAKPIEEVKRKVRSSPLAQAPQQEQETNEESNEESNDPWDKAVSDLVEMGFSAENSRRALTESGAGLNVQAAVGWLLNDAHRQAKEKAQHRSELLPDSTGGSGVSSRQRQSSADRSRAEAVPAWMRQEGRDSLPHRDASRSPAHSDVDISKTAASVGSNILKTANTLWKTSQKKVQKAVAEFSQDSDAGQPKWMRSTGNDRHQPSKKPFMPDDAEDDSSRQRVISDSTPSITTEAMLLEVDSRPSLRRTKPGPDPRFLTAASTASQDNSPASSNPSSGRSTPAPRWQQTATASALDPRSRLSKQVVEEQAYVSPARRKKATPSPKPVNEPDLLFSDSTSKEQPSTHLSQPESQVTESMPQSSKISKPSTPVPSRPKTPFRTIPPLSASALASSTKARLAGTEHFKRGDYATAHSSYSSSLVALPQNHPITIILLCNRSLTALKTGDPKSAVVDADTALKLIGPSHGEGELIDLGDGSDGCRKPMKEFWGKALMRKAEALEQMEKWKDASIVWKEAVEAGVGGATSVQGRQRCEKAFAPKPTAPRIATAKPKPRALASSDLAPPSAKSTKAVNRLREVNAAAERAEDEKFALSDSVDARIARWRDGRKDNLRALLGGMDQVLWEDSGWKKVGMHELVVNGKVKIIYMKAIAKVHPDKVCPFLSFLLNERMPMLPIAPTRCKHRNENDQRFGFCDAERSVG
jgi:hypothetical protein